MPDHRATITDVAKAAGVAVGTVSRVFNKHADVNADIREHVLSTARKLGYTRIRQRKRISDNGTPPARHGNIGVVIFGMEDTLVQLPIVSSALQGIEHELSKLGWNLMLANVPDGERVPPFIAERRVEGLILKGPNQGLLPRDPENELLRHVNGVPHVWLMGRLPNARGDHCNFDTYAAGRLAADHLAQRGHRRVAFFNPKPGQVQFEKVKLAFLAACQEAGLQASALEVEPPKQLAWPLPAITQQANVDRLVAEWLALPARTRPTALFVPSDRTATQLYTTLERRQLRPGKDVSVLSCNNERSLVANLEPGLTTIDVHAEAIGRRAVDQLVWRIQHPEDVHPVQILIEPTLAERDSVAQLS
jgi:LacI family transcriptional regulator